MLYAEGKKSDTKHYHVIPSTKYFEEAIMTKGRSRLPRTGGQDRGLIAKGTRELRR